MAGSSVTGKGNGEANKPSVKELSILANSGPNLIFAGIVSTVSEDASPPSSPPSPSNYITVNFPYALTGPSTDYVVLLTSINGGLVYIIDLAEDDDGNFSGFTALVESESDVNYLVVSKGIRPKF